MRLDTFGWNKIAAAVHIAGVGHGIYIDGFSFGMFRQWWRAYEGQVAASRYLWNLAGMFFLNLVYRCLSASPGVRVYFVDSSDPERCAINGRCRNVQVCFLKSHSFLFPTVINPFILSSAIWPMMTFEMICFSASTRVHKCVQICKYANTRTHMPAWIGWTYLKDMVCVEACGITTTAEVESG